MTLQEYWRDGWPRVEGRIRDLVDGGSPQAVREIVRYHLSDPGKRLRSYLAFRLADALGVPDGPDRVGLAASLELLHNATLAHDDLEDQDLWRRGHLNLWKRFGPAQAVNAGDLMFALSLEPLPDMDLPDGAKVDLVRRNLRAVRQLVNGQMLELSFLGTDRMTLPDWKAIAEQKTGALFRLVVEGVLVLGGHPVAPHDADLAALGRTVGVLYQSRDDLCDALGAKEGRPAGSDVLEGKMTCLAILGMARGGPSRAALHEAILDPGGMDDEARVRRALAVYREEGVLEEALSMYRDEADRLLSSPLWARFPVGGVFRDLLSLLALPSP